MERTMTSNTKASLALEEWYSKQKSKNDLTDIKFFTGDLGKYTTDYACSDIIDFVDVPTEESIASNVFEETFVQKSEDQLLRDLELVK